MSTATIRMASPKQYDFITKLVRERDLEAGRETDTLLEARAAGDLASRDASRLIELLLAAPRKVSTCPVPAGRYALSGEWTDGEVMFYKVDRPETGKWAGVVFVKQQVSDYEYPVRGDKATFVLAEIARDVEAAMALYGREIGRCGHCSRTLTSEWRERGIGPICHRQVFG